MKLIQLEARDFLRLESVVLEFPESGPLIIGGKNGAGKTSAIEAIAAALGGRPTHERPIRAGREKAEIIVQTDRFRVERAIAANGAQRLELRTPDGKKVARPQELLDSFFSALSFYPLAFMGMKPPRQVETLRALLGLDFAALDAERKGVFDDRTVVHRERDRLLKHAESLPYHPDAPAEEMSVRALAGRLEAHARAKADNDAKRRAFEAVAADYRRAEEAEKQAAREVADLEKRLAAAKDRHAELSARVGELKAAGARLRAEVNALADPDPREVEQVKDAMSDLDRANAKMRDNARRAEALADAAEKEAEASRLTARLAEIDEEKRRLIAAASMPVPGLGFADDGQGVTFHNVPLEQASQAEKLRVSCAMGFALNPQCRLLLVRDASLLDPDSLRLVCDFAREQDGQVVLERVGHGSEVQVVIEDGLVAERRGEIVTAKVNPKPDACPAPSPAAAVPAAVAGDGDLPF